jgi:OmpA family protein
MASPLPCRSRIPGMLSALAGLTLAGCAAREPAGPTVMALPAKGENFALFQQHDATCRQYASGQTGGRSPGQAAAQSAIAHAAIGTGIGAAAGALVGSASGHAGGGAAIGAGTGLLAGSLLGAASGRRATASTQNHYNIAYTQCMAANGENVAQPAPFAPVVYAPPPSVVYLPAQVYAVAPPPVPVPRPPGS